MPFIQRIVEPVFLSRPTQQSTTAEQQPSSTAITTTTTVSKATTTTATHDDFTSIANCTLANILRQLASVVLVADKILSDLGNELHTIRERSNNIQKRIVGVEKSLENIDETIIYDNDVSIYKTKRTISTSLFTASTRPQHIQKLYDQAAPTPVLLVCNDDTSSETNFSVCPLGRTRRQITKKIDADIETRVPASIEELRKWTSSEAIGEITVAPNCLAKVAASSLHNSTIAEESYASFSTSYVDGIDVTSTSTNDNVDGVNDIALDHKLPSPEEQCKLIAKKYPAEIVSVNTSNVRFERMCSIRKSLGHMPMGKMRYLEEFQATRRSLRPRKASGKRRNTIAGIDDKDIKEAYTQMRHSAVVGTSSSADDKNSQSMPRSKSNDLLRSNGTIDSLRSSNRFSNFKALKQWGKHRLKLINKIDEIVEGEVTQNGAVQNDCPKNSKPRPKTTAEKSLKQNPLYSSSEKLFTNLMESDIKVCSSPTNPVKLRTSMNRRQRRSKQYRCEEPNSSSGNWSASSESGRTSASSEIAMHKKSSNSCGSLHHNKPPVTNSAALTKRRINTSTSSSITSDDTTNHEVPTGYVDLFDDNESMYSCDTEGYFTSFHVDSGLKTLKEEESNIVPALLSTSALLPIDGSNISSNMGDSLSRTTTSVDSSDYELFGKGSTSTTASSGTVCTALLGSLSNNSLVEVPIAPERKSSLNSKLMNISNYGKPKLLTNKSESIPRRGVEKEATQMREALTNLNNFNKIDKNDSSNGAATTISDLEISENSDFEGVERVKRIKGKTQINSNRIPSICIITPLNSDDEDRVAAMESMLSSLNINQKNLPLSELGEERTVAQIHSPQSSSKQLNSVPEKKKENEDNVDKEKNDEIDGEYVTITDVGSYAHPSSYRVSDVVSKDLDQILSGNLNKRTEYVSLNELPCNTKYDENLLADAKNVRLISGTNVKLNANGMFVYDSSTLRYKRSLCTTFKGLPTAQTTDTTGDSSKHVTSKLENQEVVTEVKRMSSNSSPPFAKMASDYDSASLDDVYVTLAADKRELNTSPKSVVSVSDSELSDTSRDAKSDTWPGVAQKEDSLKEMKRRFSWENITKSSKRTSKRRHRKFILPLNFSAKKSSPKSKSTFKTSTPLKNASEKPISSKSNVNENSFGNNTSISQVTFNKPQTTTCSDRLGVPKTTLNDFKKLLLNATNKKISTTKPSAVEQLKLKHESLSSSPMKILDLSCSPKSLTNRRLLQQTQTSSSSPYKKTNLMSPRSRWKYSNFNKSSIASIPEANIEDDATSIDSENDDSNVQIVERVDEKTPIYSTPQKKPVINQDQNANISKLTPSTQKESFEPIIAKTESSPETGIIETNFSMEENLFRQAEENNFMRGEIKPYGASLAKKSTLKPIAEVSQTAADAAPVTTPAPTLETSF
ncbi:uncharacterized protein LOC129566299 isoform X2 [Sitodiplosis mosellana]|uniref:uncharacterized protein LOC129566299 isoform X2 n=1 Tax=Sitodiplosis mosellana TaxID=263140 RepID=UPI0024443ABD|nr:uncharacterized protein LOC129566299 isoform X2 [Sitodiplosis mosellana]